MQYIIQTAIVNRSVAAIHKGIIYDDIRRFWDTLCQEEEKNYLNK